MEAIVSCSLLVQSGLFIGVCSLQGLGCQHAMIAVGLGSGGGVGRPMREHIDPNATLERTLFPWMRDGRSHATRERTTLKEVAQKGVPLEYLTSYLKQEMSESESCK
eukprot:4791760-Amphidinium_carterae.1